MCWTKHSQLSCEDANVQLVIICLLDLCVEKHSCKNLAMVVTLIRSFPFPHIMLFARPDTHVRFKVQIRFHKNVINFVVFSFQSIEALAKVSFYMMLEVHWKIIRTAVIMCKWLLAVRKLCYHCQINHQQQHWEC